VSRRGPRQNDRHHAGCYICCGRPIWSVIGRVSERWNRRKALARAGVHTFMCLGEGGTFTNEERTCLSILEVSAPRIPAEDDAGGDREELSATASNAEGS